MARVQHFFLGVMALSAVASAVSPSPVQAEDKKAPHQATVQKLPADYKSSAVQDQIMVSTPIGTKPTDLADTLKEVNGTVVNTITNNAMVVYIIDVPKGTLNQKSMDKLGSDEHVSAVQLNMRSKPQE